VEFNEDEEKQLIKSVLLKKEEGVSVRGAIMELAEGDAKKALRYQNKFRNALKRKPRLVAEVVHELKAEGKDVKDVVVKSSPVSLISETQFKHLKTEINGLVARISESVRKENEYLKNRIVSLERENLKLSNLLYGCDKPDSTYEFFKGRVKRNALS